MKEKSPLSVGKRAPDFTLPRSAFQRLSLSDLSGPVVLVFYPGDWDPVSTDQLLTYEEHLPELSRFNASLLAISTDSVWSHVAYGRALNLGFPLLSDSRPKAAVSRAYGVYDEDVDRTRRALFVADESRTIRWSRVWPDNLNPGIAGILKILSDLGGSRDPP